MSKGKLITCVLIGCLLLIAIMLFNPYVKSKITDYRLFKGYLTVYPVAIVGLIGFIIYSFYTYYSYRQAARFLWLRVSQVIQSVYNYSYADAPDPSIHTSVLSEINSAIHEAQATCQETRFPGNQSKVRDETENLLYCSKPLADLKKEVEDFGSKEAVSNEDKVRLREAIEKCWSQFRMAFANNFQSYTIKPDFRNWNIPKSVHNNEERTEQSKSVAEFLFSSLSDHRKLTSFIMGLVLVAGILLLILSIGTYILDLKPSEIELSPTSSHVIFKSTSSKKSDYILVVHPQGWQNTGIHINQGDHLLFKADGSVNIDAGGLVKAAMKRQEMEAIIEKEFNLNPKFRDSDQAPEAHFNPDDIEKYIKLRRSWVDPDGFPKYENSKPTPATYLAREDRLELKNAELGCLIGGIGDDPKNLNAFKVGKQHSIVANTSGDLWLNINDVKNFQAELDQQMFYVDNLGFFWVVVTISSE